MRIKKFTFLGVLLLIVFFWTVLILYSLKFSLPNNALTLPHDSRQASNFFKLLLPEGFGFFTRNPREQRYLVYKITDQEINLVTTQNTSFSNSFGLSRKSRCQNLETSYILSKVKKEDWLECKSTLTNCSNYEKTPVLMIENSYFNPMFCGAYIMVVQEPIPWAWSANFKMESIPIYFIKVNVQCK